MPHSDDRSAGRGDPPAKPGITSGAWNPARRGRHPRFLGARLGTEGHYWINDTDEVTVPTAGEWFRRQHEVHQYIDLHRKTLRPLAEARCPDDHRLLGAVYQFPDGSWLWSVGERMAPAQANHEALEFAVMEYETAVEHGADREEAWESIVIAAGSGSPVNSDTGPSRVVPLGDPLETFRSVTFDQLTARLTDGEFASCGRCRRTYVVDDAVMQYAAGLFLSRGNARPILVHPGRVVVAGSDPALEGTQVYGLTRPWQLGPWTLDGMKSQKAVP